jgi:hypothetical protein
MFAIVPIMALSAPIVHLPASQNDNGMRHWDCCERPQGGDGMGIGAACGRAYPQYPQCANAFPRPIVHLATIDRSHMNHRANAAGHEGERGGGEGGCQGSRAGVMDLSDRATKIS